jgi:hypothetical protein
MLFTPVRIHHDTEFGTILHEISDNSSEISNVPTEPKVTSFFDDKNNLKRTSEKWKLIKTIIKKELTNEAIQAFLKIFFSSHVIIKIFWIIGVLVPTGLCSYLVLQTILAYFTYGVSTKTANIVENPTDFPKITICKYVKRNILR